MSSLLSAPLLRVRVSDSPCGSTFISPEAFLYALADYADKDSFKRLKKLWYEDRGPMLSILP